MALLPFLINFDQFLVNNSDIPILNVANFDVFSTMLIFSLTKVLADSTFYL